MRNPWIVLARAIRDGKGVRLSAEEVDALSIVGGLLIRDYALASLQECTCDLLDAAVRMNHACQYCLGEVEAEPLVDHSYVCVKCGGHGILEEGPGVVPIPICEGCRVLNQVK